MEDENTIIEEEIINPTEEGQGHEESQTNENTSQEADGQEEALLEPEQQPDPAAEFKAQQDAAAAAFEMRKEAARLKRQQELIAQQHASIPAPITEAVDEFKAHRNYEVAREQTEFYEYDAASKDPDVADLIQNYKQSLFDAQYFLAQAQYPNANKAALFTHTKENVAKMYLTQVAQLEAEGHENPVEVLALGLKAKGFRAPQRQPAAAPAAQRPMMQERHPNLKTIDANRNRTSGMATGGGTGGVLRRSLGEYMNMSVAEARKVPAAEWAAAERAFSKRT